MRRLALILAVLVSLAAPTAAEAHVTSLSVERGRLAVARYEHRTGGLVGSCRSLSRMAVICAISEPVSTGEWKGWTFESSAVARLHRR
jgi:hypothetical protein